MKKTSHIVFAAGLVALAAGLIGCATPPEETPPARVERVPSQPERPLPPVARPPTHPPVQRPPSPPKEEIPFEDVMALQIMLDRANFSPGVIDGKFGPKTKTALRAWQDTDHLDADGEFDDPTRRRVDEMAEPFTTHTVTAEDHAALTPWQTTWRGRAAAERLGYGTILESVAERYHASEAAIRKLNPDAAWPDPPAGTALRVPNPRPFKTPAASSIHISLGRKTITVFAERGRRIALFPCSIGSDPGKRPVGELQIINCAENPNYYFDPVVFPEDPEAQTINGKLVIPPGPNNPVGVAWISLSRPGYGIHGTPHPEDIGKTESHGCFRLANWNAEKIVRMISIGLPVVVEE